MSCFYRGKPKEVIAVFDDPNYLDRFTIVLNKSDGFKTSDHYYPGFSLSADQSPLGICQTAEIYYDPNGDNEHLGKEIRFADLPRNVREKIIEMLKEE